MSDSVALACRLLHAEYPSVSTETRSRKFTSAYIAALQPNTSICDISDPAVPGLVLRVAISGSKAWLFRFKWDGTLTRITLGKFPALGLAEARQLAMKNREWAGGGLIREELWIVSAREMATIGRPRRRAVRWYRGKSRLIRVTSKRGWPPRQRIEFHDLSRATARASSSSRTSTSRSGSRHKARTQRRR